MIINLNNKIIFQTSSYLLTYTNHLHFFYASFFCDSDCNSYYSGPSASQVLHNNQFGSHLWMVILPFEADWDKPSKDWGMGPGNRALCQWSESLFWAKTRTISLSSIGLLYSTRAQLLEWQGRWMLFHWLHLEDQEPNISGQCALAVKIYVALEILYPGITRNIMYKWKITV